MTEQATMFSALGIDKPRKRGRPRREFSKQDQAVARAMFLAGATVAQVCAALRTSEPTLRAAFSPAPWWNARGLGQRPTSRPRPEDDQGILT